MVTIPFARLPSAPSIPWRTVVVLVLAKASWDSVGLLAGDIAYAGPSYDVLRAFPPAGGMRTHGAVLTALTVAAILSAYHSTRTGEERWLRWCLAGYAVWYMGWTVGLASAWLYHGHVLSWGAPASVLVVAVLALVAARATPKQIGGA
ncbi:MULTISPECIES: hypothetical protein [unclassified Micromonospora]|uniref:hypothetical protein n=1 Tax=unclassified Micromonospora TaxID=2617518 RepID=UPI00332150CF